MKLTLSTLLTIGVLVVLWWTVGQGESLPSLTSKKHDNVLQLYVTDFAQWSFNEKGALIDTVQISDSHQYTEDPRIYFSKIQASHSDEDAEPWLLSANQGVYRPNAREFWLHSGVSILQKNDNRKRLETPRLRVLQKENQAINDAPVELYFDKSVTTGRGIIIDLESKVAQILENVETIYAH